MTSPHYTDYVRKIQPAVEAMLAGAEPIPPESTSSLAWVAYGLLWNKAPVSLEELIDTMDYQNHAVPQVPTLAFGLHALRERGWLVTGNGRYGLSDAGRRTLESIVGRTGFLDGAKMLDDWWIANPVRAGQVVDVVIDRDSVAAGDDMTTHGAVIRLLRTETINGFLYSKHRFEFLPNVAGGEATWVFWGNRPLAIVVQQHPDPKLLGIDWGEPLIPNACEDMPPSFFFAYHAQIHPTTVLERTAFTRRRAWFDDQLERVRGKLKHLRFTCPCCGYPTLAARRASEICGLCHWEDDGQDDADATTAKGGPNGDASLASARSNFERTGTMEPPGTAGLYGSPPPGATRLRRMMDEAVIEQRPPPWPMWEAHVARSRSA